MEKRDLTEDEINTLCRDMRVVDLFKKNPDILDSNPDIKQYFDKYCSLVDQIIECISEEQLDIVLERHRLQLQDIDDEIIKKEKRKKKKKE